MTVALAYDSSNDTVRVAPGRANTMLPAKAGCALRSWVAVDNIGLAARHAVDSFHAQVAGALLVGAGASKAIGSYSSGAPASSFSSASSGAADSCRAECPLLTGACSALSDRNDRPLSSPQTRCKDDAYQEQTYCLINCRRR